MSLREELLERRQRRPLVPLQGVLELDGLWVRVLGFAESLDLEKQRADRLGKESSAAVGARFLAAVLVDSAGQRVFEAGDAPWLAELPPEQFGRAMQQAYRANGMLQEEGKGADPNGAAGSGTVPTGVSSSSSSVLSPVSAGTATPTS